MSKETNDISIGKAFSVGYPMDHKRNQIALSVSAANFPVGISQIMYGDPRIGMVGLGIAGLLTALITADSILNGRNKLKGNIK